MQHNGILNWSHLWGGDSHQRRYHSSICTIFWIQSLYLFQMKHRQTLIVGFSIMNPKTFGFHSFATTLRNINIKFHGWQIRNMKRVRGQINHILATFQIYRITRTNESQNVISDWNKNGKSKRPIWYVRMIYGQQIVWLECPKCAWIDSCCENVIVNFINHEDGKIYIFFFFRFRSSAKMSDGKTEGKTYRNHNIMHTEIQ